MCGDDRVRGAGAECVEQVAFGSGDISRFPGQPGQFDMRFGTPDLGRGPHSQQLGGCNSSTTVDHQPGESVVAGLVTRIDFQGLAIELFGLGDLSLFADGTGEVVDVVGVVRVVGDRPLEFLGGCGVVPGVVVGQPGAVHQERAHGVASGEATDEACSQEQSEGASLSGVDTHRNPPSVSVTGEPVGVSGELRVESEARRVVRVGGPVAIEAAKVSLWPDLLQGRNCPVRGDRSRCSRPVSMVARLS